MVKIRVPWCPILFRWRALWALSHGLRPLRLDEEVKPWNWFWLERNSISLLFCLCIMMLQGLSINLKCSSWTSFILGCTLHWVDKCVYYSQIKEINDKRSRKHIKDKANNKNIQVPNFTRFYPFLL